MTEPRQSYSRDDAILDLRDIRRRQGDEPRASWITDGPEIVPAHIKEQDHVDADEVLLRYINDLEIRAWFESIGKWYS